MSDCNRDVFCDLGGVFPLGFSPCSRGRPSAGLDAVEKAPKKLKSLFDCILTCRGCGFSYKGCYSEEDASNAA